MIERVLASSSSSSLITMGWIPSSAINLFYLAKEVTDLHLDYLDFTQLPVPNFKLWGLHVLRTTDIDIKD